MWLDGDGGGIGTRPVNVTRTATLLAHVRGRIKKRAYCPRCEHTAAAVEEDPMTLATWNPWRDIETLNQQLNSLFERSAASATPAGRRSALFVPAVDIFEETDHYLVKLDLPEVAIEDVDIEIENRTLVVRGERKLENEDRRGAYHRIERANGGFSRSFTLPDHVATDLIVAACKDGVLRITLPKKAESKPRKITIEA